MNQKEALLAGAKQCLIEKGYARTTARDIAEASGAHLGSIGYHYGSKGQLMNRAALELSDEWGDTITEALHKVRGEAPRDRLAAALAAIRVSLPNTRDIQSASLQNFVQALFDDELHKELSVEVARGRASLTAQLAGEDEGAENLSEAEVALGSLTYALTVGLVVQSLIDPDGLPSPDQMKSALALLADHDDGTHRTA